MIAVAFSGARRRRAHSPYIGLALALLLGLSSACFGDGESPGESGLESGPSQPVESETPIRISLIGTNDLHGQIESLPLFSGYLANLRSAREAEGGAVVLVDAGDLFQGTLATNKDEGRGMIATYNALAYDALSLGNHDFDYGAIGPRTEERPEQDPQGALKARAREARFPFLSANLRREGGAPLSWSEVGASVLLEKAGIRVGIVAAASENLATIIRTSDFKGLEFAPAAPSVVSEARRLRERGAQVVIAVLHAGGACERFDDPTDVRSCDFEEEIFQIARDIEPGLVDVIVAGHRHDAIAHEFNAMAIIQSYSKGQAFGRVDLTLVSGKLTEVEIHPPHWLCPTGDDPRSCDPGDYEGQRVESDALLMEQVLEAEKETVVLAS
jgi:2',3'-cyclic-nucleotide 2'-phosphodiesterase (5'-nucleotidase family)